MIYYDEETYQRIDDFIGRLGKLPPLPASIQRINRMIDSESTTLDAVGREIAQDYALSAKVLQLINSSFYGFSERISSIKQAVVLLGLNVIRTLIGTSWVTELIQKSSKGLHDHALACARTIYVLSESLCIGEPEEMAAVGLLHDLGKAVQSIFLPDTFESVCTLAAEKQLCFHEAEQERLSVIHSVVGGRLLERWNLPERIYCPIMYQHHDDLPERFRKETALLKLADLMVRAEGRGFTGDNRMPDFSPEAGRELRLIPADLKALYDQAYDEMKRIPRYIGEEAL